MSGRGAKERLAVKACVSTRLIEAVSRGHIPKSENIVSILKAIGEPVPGSLTGDDDFPPNAA